MWWPPWLAACLGWAAGAGVGRPAPLCASRGPRPAPLCASRGPRPAPLCASRGLCPAPLCASRGPRPAPLCASRGPRPAPLCASRGPRPAPLCASRGPRPAPLCASRGPRPAPFCASRGPCPAPFCASRGLRPAPLCASRGLCPAPLCASRGLCPAPPGANASQPGQCPRGATDLCAWPLSSRSLLDPFPVDVIQENYVRNVRNCIFSVVYPTPFKSGVRLVAVSKEVLENILDLDISIKGTSDFLQFVSGGNVIFGSVPLAHRYGGHQFGGWAGQLGDGRAHLIGIYTNRHGERWELQLKGSGKTPYSRNGDGRAVLRSSVREFLCSEAMHYLGIPTSRAASLIVSDDDVWRDQFYNGNIRKERGAVVLRLAKSWFRIGSLEILAHAGELDLQRRLLDFIIQEHFPSIAVDDSNRYLEFFSTVVSETADLIALWMSVGFAHGVCNTDNFSLLSITIDYGPFGFMDSYDPNFVPNTSDDERRYKIGNQANVGLFNLSKLLQALKPLLDPRQKQLASQILEGYGERYYSRFTELFKTKLGLLGEDEDDNYLIAFLLKLMEDTKADFTMTFRQLSEITQDQLKELHIPEEFWAIQDLRKHKLFSEWVSMYLLRLSRNKRDSDTKRRTRMTTVNPRYVLRNWMAESAVQKAELNDFSEVHLLQQILHHPFQRQQAAEQAGYSLRPPPWAKDLKVSCSS